MPVLLNMVFPKMSASNDARRDGIGELSYGLFLSRVELQEVHHSS